mgnify:CR=1 FL=1
MVVNIDDFISWLLIQTEKDINFSSERQQRIYERVFPEKEADKNEQE